MENSKNNDPQSQGGQNGEGETQSETEKDVEKVVKEEIGLDPEEQPEAFEAAVEREKKHRENLGTAIRQKKNWREKAKSRGKGQGDSDQGDSQPSTNQGDDSDVEELVEQKMAERRMKDMDLPEEAEQEARELAQLRDIPVDEAAQTDIVQQKAEKIKRKERAKQASPNASKKGSSAPSFDPSEPLKREKYDFDTEEGVEKWREHKRKRKEYLKKQNE